MLTRNSAARVDFDQRRSLNGRNGAQGRRAETPLNQRLNTRWDTDQGQHLSGSFPHGVPPEVARIPDARSRIRDAIVAAIYDDMLALREVFTDLPVDQAEALAAVVSRRLHDAADTDARRLVWAKARQAMPDPVFRAVGAEFVKLIDARRQATSPPPREPRGNPSRSRLAKTAIRLLRTGCTPAFLTATLQAENARLPKPLPPHEVGPIAAWAGKAVREAAHVR